LQCNSNASQSGARIEHLSGIKSSAKNNISSTYDQVDIHGQTEGCRNLGMYLVKIWDVFDPSVNMSYLWHAIGIFNRFCQVGIRKQR
jgi:hypothetical protein